MIPTLNFDLVIALCGLTYLIITAMIEIPRLPILQRYEYGTCNNRHARRNMRTGEVEFVLWKAGEHGHVVDFWYRFGDGWEQSFVAYTTQT